MLLVGRVAEAHSDEDEEDEEGPDDLSQQLKLRDRQELISIKLHSPAAEKLQISIALQRSL